MVNIETPKKMAIKYVFFFLLTACYPANIAVAILVIEANPVGSAAVEREVVVQRAVVRHGMGVLHDEGIIFINTYTRDVERGTEAQRARRGFVGARHVRKGRGAVGKFLQHVIIVVDDVYDLDTECRRLGSPC